MYDLATLKLQLTAIESSEQLQVQQEWGSRTCPHCLQSFAPGPRLFCPHDHRYLLINKYSREERIMQWLRTLLNGGRYRLQGYLGQGDLTTVFGAIDLETYSTVAIKVVKSHMVQDVRRLQHFAAVFQEAMLLKHDSIASIRDVVIVKNSDNCQADLVVVMDKLQGSNLRTICSNFGRVPCYIAIESLTQACQGLEHAFQMGWLHRDLKPSNIYISVEDDKLLVKISDFGVAERMLPNCRVEPEGGKTTSIYGNAQYICPEVIMGGERTVRSEIYSLGCVMYHILTGHPVFKGVNDFVTMRQHLETEPQPFATELNIPVELEAVVMRCLLKQPSDRYQSFSDLAQALSTVKITITR